MAYPAAPTEAAEAAASGPEWIRVLPRFTPNARSAASRALASSGRPGDANTECTDGPAIEEWEAGPDRTIRSFVRRFWRHAAHSPPAPTIPPQAHRRAAPGACWPPGERDLAPDGTTADLLLVFRRPISAVPAPRAAVAFPASSQISSTSRRAPPRR